MTTNASFAPACRKIVLSQNWSHKRTTTESIPAARRNGPNRTARALCEHDGFDKINVRDISTWTASTAEPASRLSSDVAGDLRRYKNETLEPSCVENQWELTLIASGLVRNLTGDRKQLWLESQSRIQYQSGMHAPGLENHLIIPQNLLKCSDYLNDNNFVARPM